jgi:TetR/AcrR family transcriptional repressor of nem operon
MKKSISDTVETRKRIVAIASTMFLAQGLASTCIADIMTAAGLTQGGFYRHFESKEQLIAEAAGSACGQLLSLFSKATAGKPPREALATLIALYLDQSEQVSALCTLASLGSELRHCDDQVKLIVMNGHQNMVDFIAEQARLLDIPDDAGIADAIVSAMVGAVTISRLAGDAATARMILDHARAVVGRLLSTPDLRISQGSGHCANLM